MNRMNKQPSQKDMLFGFASALATFGIAEIAYEVFTKTGVSDTISFVASALIEVTSFILLCRLYASFE